LSPNEQKVALEIFNELRSNDGDSPLYDHIWELDYIEKPVPIWKFLEDDFYAGWIVPDLYPKWREMLEEIFAPGSQYYEVILGGSIGSGKTTSAAIAYVYLLYRLTCLRNPAKYYNLVERSRIVFGVYSMTKRLVADVGYGRIRAFIERMPYFRTKFPHDHRILQKVNFKKADVSVVYGCVSEGTKIATPCGDVAVEQLANTSSEVLTSYGSDVFSSEYKGVKYSGVKKCLEVITETGDSLVCSYDHKFIVEGSNGSYIRKKAGELKEGEEVFVLREIDANNRVLHESRKTFFTMQGMCEEEKQQEIPQYKKVQGQESTLGNRGNEEVLKMRCGKTSKRVRNSSCKISEFRKKIPKRQLQRVRCGIFQEMGEQEQGEKEKETSNGRRERIRPKNLCELLQEEPRENSSGKGSPREQETYKCPAAKMESKESGETQGIQEKMEGKASGTHAANFNVTSPTTEITEEECRVYPNRKRRCIYDGLFWLFLCLLWKGYKQVFYHRPYYSCSKRRRDNSSKHSSLLQEMQQQEIYSESGGVCRRFSEWEKNIPKNYEVYKTCIKSITDVGYRKTYDVVEVPKTHSVFTNNILTSNSQEFHVLGQDVFSMYMDEVNFMQDKVTAPNKAASMSEELGQAQEIYNAARSRIKSRYMRPGGYVPGMTFLLSSKTSKHSFLERHVQKVRHEIEEKKVFLAEYALWEVKPQSLYVKPKFRVQLGNALHPSRILEEYETHKDGTEVIEVPGEFKEDFERNTERALREIAGRATVGISPLFRIKEPIIKCVDGRKHPFTQDIIKISIYSDIEIVDYLMVNELFHVKDSDYVPRLNPGSPRVVHLDLSRKKDAAGFCMGHIGGLREVKKMRYDNTYYIDKEPMIVIDIIMAIKLLGEGEIDFSKIRAFIIALKEYGYPITHVTADKYQSADTLQIFSKLGYKTAFLSVDERPEPYHYTRQAFVEDRIRIYDYPLLIRELIDLEEDLDSGVIDHPNVASDGSVGSKDTSDALAGVVYTLMNEKSVMKGATVTNLTSVSLAESTPTSSPNKTDLITVRGEMKISLDHMADEVIKYINLHKSSNSLFEGLQDADDNKKG